MQHMQLNSKPLRNYVSRVFVENDVILNIRPVIV